MIKVAITGGIGSGKTTICKQLESLGYKVFYSDDVANTLVSTNVKIRREISKEFGNKSFTNNVYNRKYISKIVFNDKVKLQKLNFIFDKYIRGKFSEFCITNGLEKIVFFESAIVFENQIKNEFNKIVCVYADQNTIIKRLRKRNNFTDEEIFSRLDSQLNPEFKKNNSDFVIDTTGGNIENKVQELLNFILN